MKISLFTWNIYLLMSWKPYLDFSNLFSLLHILLHLHCLLIYLLLPLECTKMFITGTDSNWELIFSFYLTIRSQKHLHTVGYSWSRINSWQKNKMNVVVWVRENVRKIGQHCSENNIYNVCILNYKFILEV